MIVDNKNVRFKSTRSGKPGGRKADQHNKAQIWVKVDNLHLSDKEKKLIKERLSGRINTDGELEVESSESRMLEANKMFAIEKANKLILEALRSSPPRIPTRPPKSAKEVRIRIKKHQSQKKDRRHLKGLEKEL